MEKCVVRIDSSSMVRHVDCLRNVVHCFRVIYSLFGKCCVNIIAFFRFLLRFLLCRPFAFPFAAFCVLPCASSSFCAPCLPPRSFAVALPLGRSLLKCVVFLRSFLRFTVLKPWLFNEQWKCSYFDSCSKMTNLASQMPVCGVLLIECPSCGLQDNPRSRWHSLRLF